jgi:hypothetical protein
MSNVIQFPTRKKMTLSESLKEGYISSDVRRAMHLELEWLIENKPTKWDRRFIESLLSQPKGKQLSFKQKDHLEQILSSTAYCPDIFLPEEITIIFS